MPAPTMTTLNGCAFVMVNSLLLETHRSDRYSGAEVGSYLIIYAVFGLGDHPRTGISETSRLGDFVPVHP